MDLYKLSINIPKQSFQPLSVGTNNAPDCGGNPCMRASFVTKKTYENWGGCFSFETKLEIKKMVKSGKIEVF